MIDPKLKKYIINIINTHIGASIVTDIISINDSKDYKLYKVISCNLTGGKFKEFLILKELVKILENENKIKWL